MMRGTLAAAALAFAPALVSAADLVVDGTTLSLSGAQQFDNVRVVNGGKIVVAPFDGTAGTGTLALKANTITVDASSSIVADGAGNRGVADADGEGLGGGVGGVNAADGGSGGGYGGVGGSGATDYGYYGAVAGGAAYGTADGDDVDMGSAGGAAGSADGIWGAPGGNGGGAIQLEANRIDIAGLVSANGEEGFISNNDAAGGGSGGGILLRGRVVVNAGLVSADGGSGALNRCIPDVYGCGQDDGGGGGAGGRVKVFYGVLTDGSFSAAGGPGSIFGGAGESGTIFKKRVVIPVAIDVKPGVLPNTIQRGANGTTAVAILSDPDFAATTVDPSTVVFAGAKVVVKSDGTLMVLAEDVNLDGLPDLVVHFTTGTLLLALTDVQATLTGATFDGLQITGTDSVRVTK